MHPFSAAFALLAISLQAQAHMLLWKPWRFNQTGDNSPLVGPGEGISNYPCKVMGNYEFDFDRTQIPLGSQYEVVFEGESVHGGGSCQFALSKDLEPNAQSEFKVIHSIEGGCPARNTPGNLGADDSSTTLDPFTYNFTMPSNIPAGKYTFAWSWFNKVGNREMYMNCAPIEVTSGSGKRSMLPRDSSAFDNLPDLFLANIPDVKCTTSYYPGDMTFPDPGNIVVQNVPANQRSSPVLNGASVNDCKAPVRAQAANPSGSAAPTSAGGYGSSGGYGGSGGSGASSSVVPISSSAPQSTGGYGNYDYNSGGSSVTPIASSVPVPSYTSSAPLASPTQMYPVNNGSSSGGFSGSPSSPGSCGAGQVSCSGAGTVLCIGRDQFGLCNNGCAVPQALAAGTTCSGGMITKRGLRLPPQMRRIRMFGFF